MKKITELEKEELVSLILNAIPKLGIGEECLECAVCGKTAKARYYYICNNCNERM